VGENQGRAPRIGFVVDWLRDSYQLEVLRGAARAARQRDAELIVLPGGVIGADHDHGQCRNQLYRLIQREYFDGLVVMTGTLGNARGTDIMAEIAPDFPLERVCHIAVEVPGSPAVLIENLSGMRRIIEHLIYVHRARKIAFIRGPESNPEAEARYQAYLDVLETHELEFDARLVVPGDFLRHAGTEAIVSLFDERGLRSEDIDAIVAADDLMALAAMEELRKRGIRVPSQIAVVGFDDVEEARYATPPLSTVHQPLGQQGEVAVEKVLSAISGGPVRRSRSLDTLCVYRRSCGCTAEDPGGLTARPKSESRFTLLESVKRRREQIVGEIRGTTDRALPDLNDGWQDEIVSALVETLEGREEAFRESFDMFLEILLETGADAALGQVVVSALRRQLSVCAGDDPAQIRRVEGLLHDARILTGNAVGRCEAQKRLQLEQQAATLVEISAQLATVTAQEWAQTVARELPRLGIDHCMVLSLQGDQLQIEMNLHGGQLVPTSRSAGVPFLEFSSSAVSFGTSGKNLMIQPLDDGTKLTGIAVFRLDEVKPHLIEIVRNQISAALPRLLG
jgi:DNA-binding LacI/PurR family transcriptional regulator